MSEASVRPPNERLKVYARPQTLIRIGGRRRLNVLIAGEGGPAVIMDTGLGGTNINWARVQPAIARQTATFAFDHAGLGFSDPGPLPRTSAAIVEDLRRALAVAGFRPPYILVGQSAGGLNMQLFAYQHPAEVAGLVFVDPSSAHQVRVFEPDPAARRRVSRDQQEHYSSLLRLARAGRLTADAQLGGEPIGRPLPSLPDEVNAAQLAQALSTGRWRTLASEMRSIAGLSSDQVVAARRDLGDIPLIVLSAGRQQIDPDRPGAEARLAGWRAMHAEIASHSTRGEVRIVDAGHNMHVESPAFVIEAITEVLAATHAV